MKEKKEYVELMTEAEAQITKEVEELLETKPTDVVKAIDKFNEIFEAHLGKFPDFEVDYIDFDSIDFEKATVGDLKEINDEIIAEEKVQDYINATKGLINDFFSKQIISDVVCNKYPEEDPAKLIVVANLLSKKVEINELEKEIESVFILKD